MVTEEVYKRMRALELERLQVGLRLAMTKPDVI